VKPLEKYRGYGPGGLSKDKWWPILTGDVENPEEDIVIGWAPAEYGCMGISSKQVFSADMKGVSTSEILGLCENRGYSLRMTEEKDE